MNKVRLKNMVRIARHGPRKDLHMLNVSGDVLRRLGWRTGDKLKLLEGYGADLGLFMLKKDPDGERKVYRQSAGSKARSISLPTRQIGLKPPPRSFKAIPFEVDGDALIINLKTEMRLPLNEDGPSGV